MSGGFIQIAADVSAAQGALSATRKSLVSIRNGVLRIAARYAMRKEKAAIMSSGLRRRTGALRSSLTVKLNRRRGEANVVPLSKRSLSLIPKGKQTAERVAWSKTQALSYGAERGKWRIRGKGFVKAGREAAESGGWKADVEKYVQKELQKYWR